MSMRDPIDPKPFEFRVKGHGQDVPAGTYMADDEAKAFKLALRQCKAFDLPGWELYCVTTGNSQMVSEFIEGYDGEGKPIRARA